MIWTPGEVRTWSEHAADSPLYSHLAQVIAADPDLMGVLNRIDHHPAPNILFAAVQLFLAEDPRHPLASHYPNLTPESLPPNRAGATFRQMVMDREEDIAAIGATRHTQTNECRRCTALLPGVWAGTFERFHLIDIGASAGLNLALDRYSYRWGEVEWGRSPLLLEAEPRGDSPRPRDIRVERRIGLDLNPVDPTNPDDRAWLEALVWPEESERSERLSRALDLIVGTGVEMVAGDAVETLPAVLEALPSGEPAVVMNSYTLNQFAAEGRAAFGGIIADARRDRPIHRVSLEFRLDHNKGAFLAVDDGSGWRDLGEAHHHGAWLNLYVLP